LKQTRAAIEAKIKRLNVRESAPPAAEEREKDGAPATAQRFSEATTNEVTAWRGQTKGLPLVPKVVAFAAQLRVKKWR